LLVVTGSEVFVVFHLDVYLVERPSAAY
jgi:hypothetical protein